MSEEFKKEEINGEAAEETKAAEHTEEVKAETTAEQSAAETEKPQETAEAPKAEEKKTTTYSWVNPKISGKTGEENNSASYTGKPEPSEAKAERTSSAKTEHYQYQSQTQSAPKQEKPQFSAVPQPQDHKKKAKKPMSAAKKCESTPVSRTVSAPWEDSSAGWNRIFTVPCNSSFLSCNSNAAPNTAAV